MHSPCNVIKTGFLVHQLRKNFDQFLDSLSMEEDFESFVDSFYDGDDKDYILYLLEQFLLNLEVLDDSRHMYISHSSKVLPNLIEKIRESEEEEIKETIDV